MPLRSIAFLLATLAFTPTGQATAEKPNVVLFLADDLGWTGLRSFGSDFYETPNLDRLAAQGIKFTDAYAACTVCSPTRASVMTGMYPARLHLTNFIPGQFRPHARMTVPQWTKGLESRHTTLPEALRAGGYRTIHIGKWHLNFPEEAPDPTRHGFDFSQDKPAGTKGYFLSQKAMNEVGAETNYVTDHFGDLAAEQIAASGDTPFFIYFAFHVPHTPIQGREDLVQSFTSKVNPEATHHNPTYAAMVKSMDMAVGRVLEALEENGKADNTLILFTSDNGGLTQRYGKHDEFTENLPLRRGKGSAYEGGVRVPTIAWWPGITPEGAVCDEPIMTIDLYPTLLDLAGLPGNAAHNAKMDGISFLPLLKDPTQELDREALFWHFPHYHAGGDSPYTSMRQREWRLIEFHETGELALYNLDEDLGEATNLASAKPKLAKRLHGRLQEWRQEVGAQMPTLNPNFDPERATEVQKQSRRK